MRNLINFLIQYSVLFLFLVLEVISFGLIIRNQDYQKSVFLSSSNTVVSEMYVISNSFVEFFKLKGANQSLADENTALMNEIIVLKDQLYSLTPVTKDSLTHQITSDQDYKLISAKVINSSTNKLQNYITLNKGARDGVKIDMGVINEHGVIGIVKTVSEKFSVVIPILNNAVRINTKFKRNNYTGPLAWNGLDYRYANLNDIARHVEFSLGDTLVTSGFTDTFPEGIPIGTIDDFEIKESEAYYNIKVKLMVNFRTISHAMVIDYLNYDEQRSIEKEAQN